MTTPRIFIGSGFVLLGRRVEPVTVSVIADSFDAAFAAVTARIEASYPRGEVVVSAIQRFNP